MTETRDIETVLQSAWRLLRRLDTQTMQLARWRMSPDVRRMLLIYAGGLRYTGGISPLSPVGSEDRLFGIPFVVDAREPMGVLRLEMDA